MPEPEARVHVVILAGGVGSRFWPASTPRRPKQLLRLAGPRPLVRETMERARSLAPPDRIHILAGRHLVAPFRAVLEEPDDGLFWIEPAARGTGPVLAWAAQRIAAADPGAVMVSLHSDHFIEPPDRFRDTVGLAARLAAREDLLFTLAVRPDRPETGYGYLRPGAPLEADGRARAWRLGAFVEKPDGATARRYLDEGYLWNSGIFVWTAARFLAEVRAHAPEIAPHLPLAEQGDDAAYFEAVDPISVDEAVLERSDRVGTLEAGFDWDDVGDWNALARTRGRDASGNAVEGPAHLLDAHRNVVWAEDGRVALFGVDDLVVARSAGITLVAPRDRAAELKRFVEALPTEWRAPHDPSGQGSEP